MQKDQLMPYNNVIPVYCGNHILYIYIYIYIACIGCVINNMYIFNLRIISDNSLSSTVPIKTTKNAN